MRARHGLKAQRAILQGREEAFEERVLPQLREVKAAGVASEPPLDIPIADPGALPLPLVLQEDILLQAPILMVISTWS